MSNSCAKAVEQLNQYSVSTVRCSGPKCEQVKRLTNHWWIVRVGLSDRITCAPAFVSYAYRPDEELLDDERPVCGQQCAQRLYERFLTTGKL